VFFHKHLNEDKQLTDDSFTGIILQNKLQKYKCASRWNMRDQGTQRKF